MQQCAHSKGRAGLRVVHGVHAGLQCHHAGGTHADTHKHTFFLRNQLLSVAIVPHAHRPVSGSEALCRADLSVEANTDDALTSPCAQRTPTPTPTPTISTLSCKVCDRWATPNSPAPRVPQSWNGHVSSNSMRKPDQNAKQRWWQVRCAMQPVSVCLFEQGGAALELPHPARHPDSPSNQGLLTMVRIVSQNASCCIASVNLPPRSAGEHTVEGGHTHPQQPASSAKATFQKP